MIGAGCTRLGQSTETGGVVHVPHSKHQKALRSGEIRPLGGPLLHRLLSRSGAAPAAKAVRKGGAK